MSPLTQLFAVVAAVYAFDCLRWTPRSTLALRALGVGRFRRARPSPFVGSAHAGPVWAQPLPPLGSVLRAEAWPVAVSPDALATREPLELELGHRSAFAPRALLWEHVGELATSGRDVLVDGRVFVSCGSSRAASSLAERLEVVRGTPRERRAAAIARELDAVLDGGEARRRVEAFGAGTRGLRRLCIAMFAWLGVVAPAAAFGLGTLVTWIPLLAVLLALQAAIFARLRRAFLELRPGQDAERRAALLSIALSPMGAARALDELSWDLLADLHPIAASALLPAGQRAEVVRAVSVDACWPRTADEADALARATDEWFRERLEQALVRSGLEPRAALAAPAPEDGDCASWCPRCRRQFAANAGSCFDCTCALRPLRDAG